MSNINRIAIAQNSISARIMDLRQHIHDSFWEGSISTTTFVDDGKSSLRSGSGLDTSISSRESITSLSESTRKLTCRHPGCTRSFQRQIELTRHAKRHTRPWMCIWPGCIVKETFGSKADWKRHEANAHWSYETYICSEWSHRTGNKCFEKFARADQYKVHLKKNHGLWDEAHLRGKLEQDQQINALPLEYLCGFCKEMKSTISGSTIDSDINEVWDQRFNHIAQHFREGLTRAEWRTAGKPVISVLNVEGSSSIQGFSQQCPIFDPDDISIDIGFDVGRSDDSNSTFRSHSSNTEPSSNNRFGNPNSCVSVCKTSKKTELDTVESILRSELPTGAERSATVLYLDRVFEHISYSLLPHVPKDRPRSEIIDILSNRIEYSVFESTNYEQSSPVQRMWTLFYSYQHTELKEIHKILAESIEQRLTPRENRREQQEHHNKSGMSVNEKLKLWHGHTADSMMVNDLVNFLCDMEPEAMEMICNQVLALSKHADHPDNDPCIRRLIKATKQDLVSSSLSKRTMTMIQEELLFDHAKSKTPDMAFRLKSSYALQGITLEINMIWDLADYIGQQAAGIKARGANEKSIISIEKLGQAITLMGSATDAEALTCFEYLDRMWPKSGRKVLECIQRASENRSCCSSDPIPGMVELWLFFSMGKLEVLVEGEQHSVIEVLQIIIWLSSVFRSSDIDTGVVTCTPSIYPEISPFTPTARRLYRVEHHLEPLGKQGAGQCWHDMLHNPIVVLGYPVKYRSQGNLNTGLEISLPIVASLIQSTKVIVLDGKLFLKGFSSILVPTTTDSEIIRWHYMFDADGDYLPFNVATACTPIALTSNDIENRRHVIGWCSEAKTNVGAPTSSYAISPSDLEKTSSSIVFKSFSLSAGQFASLGTSIVLGVKDPPAHVSPVGLGIMDKLLWMENRFVVLWDSKDNRGWLVDGISALLHMLRASLKASQNSRFFKSAFKLKEAEICEPDEPYPQAAFDFFTINDHKNLELELYLRKLEVVSERIAGNESTSSTKMKTTLVLMQDRVEYLWETLAQIITQQVEFTKREGYYWKPQFRETLEGWDFANLVSYQSSFEPVMAKMDCFSEPWVHFVRSINAVVLFGEGFGELIEPTVDSLSGLCSEWKSLPKDKNYLATTFSTLEQIQKRHGKIGTIPMEISKGFVWYNPTDNIAPCKCNPSKDDKHMDVVQVVWPSFLKPNTQSTSSPRADQNLKANAALVFGQNQNYRWWQDLAGKFIKGLPSRKVRSTDKVSLLSTKRKDVSEDIAEYADGSTTPESTTSSPDSQPSQVLTDATEVSEGASSESSKRRKLLSSFPDLSFRSRSKS